MAGETAPLAPHPELEVRDQRDDLGLPHGQTGAGVEAVDRPLGTKDGVDADYGLVRERRDRGCLPAAPGGGGDVGELEELAPAVRPAERLGDRSGRAAVLVEAPEAGIGIGRLLNTSPNQPLDDSICSIFGGRG
jgi:hypothetical protein